jgi:hypothetical protein
VKAELPHPFVHIPLAAAAEGFVPHTIRMNPRADTTFRNTVFQLSPKSIVMLSERRLAAKGFWKQARRQAG